MSIKKIYIFFNVVGICFHWNYEQDCDKISKTEDQGQLEVYVIMPYKIAVVDDNPTDMAYMASLAKRWADSRDAAIHVRSFPSAESFLFLYSEDKSWDILLLDIELGGQSGMELARVIRRENTAVQLIFITGFPDYIAEGYDVSALHYLMKPVSEEKLHTVLDRAAANLTRAEKRLCITFDHHTNCIPLDQICYIEAQKHYVAIHANDKTYRMKASLTDTEKLLDEYFFKCQRSFLVNLRYIKRITREYVILKNDEEIPISRGMAEKIGQEIIRLF